MPTDLDIAPAADHDASPRRPRRITWFTRVVRVIAVLLLGGAAVWLMLIERSVRQLEAIIATFLVGHLYADHAVVSFIGPDPTYTFGIGKNWWSGVITQECSIAYYLGAILLVTAASLLFLRLRLVRVLLAGIVSCVVLVILNQVRFVILGWVFSSYGRNTFDWAHSLGGSFLMLLGLALSLLLFFLFAFRGGAGRRSRGGRTVN